MSAGWSYFLDFKNEAFELSDGELTVGRSRVCDVTIDDPSVSRRHVVLKADSGRILLQDLGSSNGTFVNGAKVEASAELHHGDALGLGDADVSVRVIGMSAFETVRMDAVPAQGHGDATLFLQEASAKLAQEAMGQEAGAPPASAPPVSAPPTFAGGPSHMAPPPVQASPAAVPHMTPAPLQPPAAAAPPAAAPPAAPSPPPEPPTAPLSPPQSFSPPAAAPPAAAPPAAAPPAAAPPAATPSAMAPPAAAPSAMAPPAAAPPAMAPPAAAPSAMAPPAAAPPAMAPPAAAPPAAAIPAPAAPVAPAQPTTPAAAVQPAPPVAVQPAAPVQPAASAAPDAGLAAGDVRLDQTTGELLPSLDGFDSTMGPEMLEAMRVEAAANPPPAAAEPAQNPYSNPYSSPAPTAATAGFGVRFLAFCIDWVWMAAVTAGAYLFGGQQIGALVGSGLSLVVMLFGWAIWGTTPGKRVCKLYLSAGADNHAGIGFPRALARIVGYIASSLTLGIGFLMIAFSKSNRGLHDLIAGTEVRRQA